MAKVLSKINDELILAIHRHMYMYVHVHVQYVYNIYIHVHVHVPGQELYISYTSICAVQSCTCLYGCTSTYFCQVEKIHCV